MSTPTLTRTSGSGGPQLYWMDDSGEQYEIDRDQIVTDIEGEHLCTLVGVSDPFQYNSKQWGEKTGIRLLFEVAAGERKGDRFSLMFGFSIGKKARMTKVIEALRHGSLEDGDEVALSDLLGEHCYVFVTISETTKDGTTYQNTNFEGAREYKAKAKPKQQPKAAPSRAAAPIEEDDDPFDGDEVPY